VKRVIDSFRGEVPRLTPRALAESGAQEAVNCRLLSGDLTAWKQFANTQTLVRTGPVRSIFLMNNAWLSSDLDLNYARGAIPGDTTYRTYITGMDVPRFTNYAMATTGAQPYPVTTRPLGVPNPDSVPTVVPGIDPTPSSFSINVLDAGDGLATNWVASPIGTGAGLLSLVEQDAAFGNPAPSYRFSYDEVHNPGQAPYAYRNFGVAASQILQASVDFCIPPSSSTNILQACMILGASVGGVGVKVMYQQGSGGDGLGVLLIGTTTAWDLYGSTEASRSARVSISPNIWYTMTASLILNSDGTTTVTAGLYAGSGQITTVVATVNVLRGDYCGMVNAIGDDAPYRFITNYDNYHVQASGASSYVPLTLATSYVFTYVNDIGEESGPSLPSATVLRPDGVSVTVTTPTGLASGISSTYGIATKRIYRAATGNTGTVFRFVAEIPLATAAYVDVLTDEQLGEVLATSDWELPPDDLRGILALPNGVMAGFSKNQLCLSAKNSPHAWPLGNRLSTDTNIVGIGNVDTTVVIGTESFVYVASGTDPSAYSMNKFEVPQAASSKNSFAYLANIGVTFAGPDGLMAVQGIGVVKNLTDSVFTREQWQTLNPSSMRAVSHNDIYFLFWESGSSRGCYAVDMKQNGFGIVEMAFHACAAYVDPIADKMYLVLDENYEPDDPSLPIRPSAQPTANGITIAQFEGNKSVLMQYRYRSKLWLLEHPAWFSIAQVRAGDFSNLVARVYGNGAQVDEVVVTSETEFTLAEADSYAALELEFVGTSTVRSMQVAEDIAEIS